MVKIILEKEECLGCEVCVELCPSAFAFLEDESVAEVIEGADPEDECVDEAIASCPAGCISKE